MRLKHFLSVFLTLLTLSVGQMWGGSIELTYSDFGYNSTTYSSKSITKTVSITCNNGARNDAGSSNYRLAMKASAQLYNTTELPGKITSIVISNVAFSSASSAGFYVYGSTTSQGTTTTLLNNTGTTGNINVSFSGYNYKYFTIANKSSRALYNTKITINYEDAPSNTPTITKTASMTTFGCNMTTGVPTKQSFTVSGTNLKAAISVTPPSGYEISTSQDGAYQTTAISLPKNSSNAVETTTIWVRLKEDNTAGSYSGNIACESTDATTQNVAVSGSTPFKVTWQANGQTHATTYVAYAANPGTAIGTFPDDPDPDDYTCSGTNRAFYGWYNGASYKNANTAPDIITTSTKITSDKTFNAVFADASGGGSTTKWVLTSLNAVTEGTYALMTGDYHAFNGSISSGKGGITTNAFSFTNGEATSAPTGTCEITFQAVTGGFKMYNSSNGYLYAKGNTSGNLGWHNSESSYWSYASSNWVYNSNSARLRSYNDGNFNTYSSDNGNLITLAKKTTVSNTTYSNYMTTCCTTLGQINGSFYPYRFYFFIISLCQCSLLSFF